MQSKQKDTHKEEQTQLQGRVQAAAWKRRGIVHKQRAAVQFLIVCFCGDLCHNLLLETCIVWRGGGIISLRPARSLSASLVLVTRQDDTIPRADSICLTG